MSTTLPFPMPLSEKYRPRAIADFVGLDKPKRILAKFAANPYPSAWLFIGPPGTGKTRWLSRWPRRIRAEVHHIPCNNATSPTSRMSSANAGMFRFRAGSTSCWLTKLTECRMPRNYTFCRSWMPLLFRLGPFSSLHAIQPMALKHVFSRVHGRSSFPATAWRARQHDCLRLFGNPKRMAHRPLISPAS